MDRKNTIILGMALLLVVLSGYLVYNARQQQDLQKQLLRTMEYNAANVGGDGKSRSKDPYKEIAVRNTLRKKERSIQQCYNQYLKTTPKKTDGFVEIDWIIQEDGTVKKTELISSDLHAPSLSQCIVNIIAAMEFPQPPLGGPFYMTYKYNFKKTTD